MSNVDAYRKGIRHMEIEILVFEIDGHSFGVRSTDVVEVLRAATLTRLPKAPESVEGMLNLRGQILPVLNTRSLLGMEQRKMQHTDHLIVVRAGKHKVVLRADRAIDLVRVSPDETDEHVDDRSSGQLIEMIGKTAMGLVNVIDSQRLLSQSEAESLFKSLAGHSASEVTA